jgi:ABC-type sugar transport system substrate-binding protein
MALMVAGCGSSDDDGSSTSAGTTADASFTIGLMVLNTKDEFFVDQIKQVEKLVAARGGDLTVLDAKNDPTTQLQVAQDWLNTGTVDALIGSTVDVNAFQPALDQAAEQKVPVVLLGYEPKQLQTAQTTITLNFKDYGRLMGTMLARCIDERLGGKAQVALTTGPNLPGPVMADRIDGVKEALAEESPQSQVFEGFNSDGSRLKTLQTIQTLRQAHPDINAVVVPNGDDGALGALGAFKDDDKSELCIIGVESTRQGVQAFEDGDLYSQIDMGVLTLYGMTVDAAVALIKDPTDPKYSGKVISTRTFKPVYR